MAFFLNPPLSPRNGHMLRCLLPCRVSDPRKQDIRSLADQEALLSNWINQHTDLPFETTVLEGKESGEWIERADYLRLIQLVESGQFDLVLTEDLGRIIRRLHAHLFAELCCDHSTRLMSINDHIDTAQPGWEDRSIFSAWHHERSNRDTSDRIKRAHHNRFDQGACLSIPIFGYIKPPGATSDDDLRKDAAAEPIYCEWFRMLDRGAFYAEVGDYLNASGVATGPYARTKTWDGPMVSRITHNTILKGVRFRNRRKSRRNSKGKYISIKADPSELRRRRAPHLAFFDEEYYDRIVAKADERNARYRRKPINGVDPLASVPRKRTRFPGQMLFCGICGRKFIFGGHGRTEHLMCSGAGSHRCWNGSTICGPLAAQKVAEAVLAEIQALPGFDDAFLAAVEEEAARLDCSRDDRRRGLSQSAEKISHEIGNVLEFVRNGDSSCRVREELLRLEREHARIAAELRCLDQTPGEAIRVPPINDLKRLASEAVSGLAVESYEFANIMRQLIRKIVVLPFRLCDGGKIVHRAHFRLHLSALLSDPRLQQILAQPLERILTVDLFDPPQREAHRRRIVAARASGVTEREAAAACDITITAAQRAAGLQRRMAELRLDDPYVPVTEPPVDFTRLRRHLNARYRFEPLEGAGEI
jgi:site-specific DNA recombinase